MGETSYLMVMVVCIFIISSSWAVDSDLYVKIFFDEASTACNAQQQAQPPKEVDMFTNIKSRSLSCTLRCKLDPSCDYFMIDNNKCLLYEGEAPAGLSNDRNGQLKSAYYKKAGGSGDVSLFRPIIATDTLADFPVPFTSIVDGVNCGRVDKYSCPCTKKDKKPYITIDLEEPRDLSSVVITPSMGTRGPSLKTIRIYIGDTGSYETDTEVAQRDSSYVTAYTAETFPVSARGRYVTIHRTYSAGGSLCFCHIQIFGI